jgi:cysteinyl-tRNA synthetase
MEREKSRKMSAMPDLTLYNTLTRQKEPFKPIDPANVRMYVCGPTVYDYAHIGNARPAIVFDVLFRLLRHLYGEDHVTYVRNITDVDDKINARALRDHPELPLNEAIRAVTEKTLSQYLEDTAALGCLEPTFQPRATEHIGGMVAMIQALIERGHAYVAEGSEGREVLFDVSSMPDYGGLSKRNLDEQQAGARIAVEEHKKNPADFVLWKESSATEPGWDADFEDTKIHGRPGWHIECSVMSEEHLGPVFDIHGGGLDLIFPHHENEIAQSRCAHGTAQMANVWMHNGFLQVEGKKMSKSEGNFFTIHELMHSEKFGGRKWQGSVLRLAMLMTHYREPIDFSQRRLEEAERRLRKWQARSAMLMEKDYSQPPQEFLDALCDDLDCTKAFSVLDRLFDSPPTQENDKFVAGMLRFLGLQQSAEEAMGLLRGFTAIQGYKFKYYAKDNIPDIVELDRFHEVWRTIDVNAEIDRRLAFIREKNWAEADRIRDELATQGIQLKDGKDTETGERVTTWEVKR